MPYKHPTPYGNGPVVEIFPDVFAVEGKFPLNPLAIITRIMTIVRHNGELTIINSLRMSPETEKDLEKLGTVKHVVRLCFGHGCDDPYYVTKYNATLWGCKGMTYKPETNIKITSFLNEGSPIPGVIEPIIFTHVNPKCGGDAQLLIKKEKGILVSSDAVQSYGNQDLRLSKLDNNGFAKFIMSMVGIKGRANSPPLFFKIHSVNGKPSGMVEDFEKVKAAEFDALIPPHGRVIKAGAKQAFLDAQKAINWK